MVKIFTKCSAMILMAVVTILASVGPAAAVDAPKWVASIFMEAQRSVGLRWMPVPGATAYKVLRSEKAGADYKEIASSPQPQHFDAAVEPGSTYYYVLQAVAGAETSPNSVEKSVVIPGQKKKVLAVPEWAKDPVVQESTEFGKSSFRVGLLWNKNNDAIAYNLYKSTTPGKDYAMLSSVSENQAVDTAVEAGKTYYYVLSALDNGFQETGMSAEKKVVVEAAKKEVKKKFVKLVVAGRAMKKLWQKERGDENGKFDLFEPPDIAIDEGDDVLYITSNNSQQVYSVKASTGEMIKAIGGKGTEPGQFLYPLGLYVSDGVLYVVDRVKKNIQTFRNGTFVKEFPLEVPANQKVVGEPLPMDIAVDGKSGDMYIADRGLDRVWVLNSAGKFQRFIGEPGLEAGKMSVPAYIGFDPGGNIVVVNLGSTRVSTFDKETGEHLRSFGDARPGVGTFVGIGGFSIDNKGNIIVLDGQSATAQGFLPDGRYLFHLANEKGDGGAPLFAPKSLVIDSKNRVFVSEGLVNRVQAFEITGAVPAPQEEAATP